MLDLTKAKEIKRAQAQISGNEVSGTADFTEYQLETTTFVHIMVNIKGDPSILTPGEHGCHLHEKGVCEEPEKFMTAKGHFDPGPGGNSDPDLNHPYHSGDLPNIIVDQSGNGHLETISTRFTLSDGPLSILGGEGTCLMVHGHHDQLCSGPTKSGVSGGPRLSCGVIQ